jgi:UDP-glucose 4-epimerase
LKEEHVTEEKVLLVTGVAGFWGSRVAARLASEAKTHVIGVDRDRPEKGIQGLDFVPADVRNPLLAELLASEEVDTVCHLAFAETTTPQAAAYDLNVVGTSKVLEACAEANVRKVVLKSSTAIYGARPSNPAFLAEDHALRGSKTWGTVRDLVDIEKYCQGFRRQAPDVEVTTLRFANIVGPSVDTSMTRFLKDPSTPSLLGFDPRMQIIHEDDVVAALVHAIKEDVPGVFNVAATDVLPLNKMRGLASKPPVAVVHLLAYWGMGLRGHAGRRVKRHLPLEPDYLRYPWVADLRRMREELGFEPRYMAEDTVRQFAETSQMSQYALGPAGMSHDEEQLRTILDQRRQIREAQTLTEVTTEEGTEDE